MGPIKTLSSLLLSLSRLWAVDPQTISAVTRDMPDRLTIGPTRGAGYFMFTLPFADDLTRSNVSFTYSGKHVDTITITPACDSQERCDGAWRQWDRLADASFGVPILNQKGCVTVRRNAQADVIVWGRAHVELHPPSKKTTEELLQPLYASFVGCDSFRKHQ